MSEPFDLEKLLNTPQKPDLPAALGEVARSVDRLVLTPAQVKEKVKKGKLYLRDETSTYKLGPPQRPDYFHDNGFLGRAGEPLGKLCAPTAEDMRMKETMLTRLQAGELMCNDRENKKDWPWQNRQRFVPKCGGNQPDANLAMRNFLFGNGKSRRVNYERYLKDEDSHGGRAMGSQTAVRILINDLIPHAEAIGLNRQKFSITSKNMYSIGDKGTFAPGPQNWNWRRTLGAHVIWISGDFTAEAAKNGTHIIYKGKIKFEIEDRYNFNPGSSDGKLKIADKEGGMLELSGLGKQFMTYATLYRHIEWDEGKADSVKISAMPGAPVEKEDFAKEEADLMAAQERADMNIYPKEWKKLFDEYVETLSNN